MQWAMQWWRTQRWCGCCLTLTLTVTLTLALTLTLTLTLNLTLTLLRLGAACLSRTLALTPNAEPRTPNLNP